MKARIFLTLIILIAYTGVWGQVNLDKVKAPSSPGASVIGIQPTTILTPKSYEALEANLFSNYVSDAGELLIPNNVGLEFTPYWMKDHKMTATEYLFPNPWQSLVRNLSVSIASTQSFMLGDSLQSNAMGIGLRTSMYFPGRKNIKTAENFLDSLILSGRIKNIVTAYAVELLWSYPDSIHSKDEFIFLLVKMLKEQNVKLKFFRTPEICDKTLAGLSEELRNKLPEYSPQTKEMFFEVLNTVLDAFLNRASKLEKIENFRDFRPGLSIDLAGALALNFPTNRFDYSIVPKNSLWLTLSYRFSEGWKFLRVLGVLKYNWYDHNFYEKYFAGQKFFDHNIDYGIGLNFNYRNFSAQIEAVGRQSKSIIEQSTSPSGITTTRWKTESDFQYIANISYHLSDGMIITYSLGNRFEPVLSYTGTLVSTLSLNFGFGGPKEGTIK